jgi:hypothetical protein
MSELKLRPPKGPFQGGLMSELKLRPPKAFQGGLMSELKLRPPKDLLKQIVEKAEAILQGLKPRVLAFECRS